MKMHVTTKSTNLHVYSCYRGWGAQLWSGNGERCVIEMETCEHI